MNWIDLPSADQLRWTLCWTLIHFLWQGCAIAAMLGIARFMLRRGTSQVQYVTSCTAMAACAAVPVLTFLTLFPAPLRVLPPSGNAILTKSAWAASPAVPLPDIPQITAGDTASITESGPTWRERINTAASGIVAAWLVGACLLAGWRFIGWVWAHQLRRSGKPILDPAWTMQLERMKQALQITREIPLISTPQIDFPAVIGCLKPAILFPAACLTSLTPNQLQAILAHELAHVRRHDYLVNLLQTTVETVLFFHPAVWWISSRITEDREDCCDDIAARLCDNRLSYASALTALETHRSPSSPALAATGGNLLRRVRRIMGLAPTAPQGSWWPVGGMVLTLLVLLAVQDRTSGQNTPATVPSRPIEVLCVDEAGNPVAGAGVFLVDFGSGQRVGRKGTSDQNGRLTFAGLPGAPANPGYASAYARVPGKLAGVGQRILSPNFPEGPELLITLRPVVPHRGTLTLPDGIDPTTLRVTLDMITGVSPPDVPMARNFSPDKDVDRSFWPEVFERPIKADHTFELDDVPENCDVFARISGPGVATVMVQWNSNQQPKETTATIAAEAILEGKVIFDPPADSLKTLVIRGMSYPSSFPPTVGKLVPHRAKVAQDGNFRFPALASGTYNLSIEEIPAGWISGGLKVPVAGGQTVRDQVIRLERGIDLQGTVLDAQTLKPLAGATVRANVRDGNATFNSQPSDAQGSFSVKVPTAPLSITVSGFPDGYIPTRDPITNVRQPRTPTVELDLSKPQPGADPPRLEIRIQRNFSNIELPPVNPTTRAVTPAR